MQQPYGGSFDHVRLRVSDQETSALGGSAARAAAYGDTVWIREHGYRPGSITTGAILAHELAHVHQQAMTGSAEADSMERAAGRGRRPLTGTGPHPEPTARLGGGLRLPRCSATEVPAKLAELDVDAKGPAAGRGPDLPTVGGVAASVRPGDPGRRCGTLVSATRYGPGG
jgi:hypothetical protein